MVKIYDNVLIENEMIFLEKQCNSFIPNEEPHNFLKENKKNYYFRMFINENNIFSFHHKILNDFKNEKNIKYNLSEVWINKINSESNKNDKYHCDSSDLTILIFLNDNFDGGEFEYLNNTGGIDKIIPTKNKAIIMDNKLYHRVLPVSSGERFTLVCFCIVNKKENKTLI